MLGEETGWLKRELKSQGWTEFREEGLLDPGDLFALQAGAEPWEAWVVAKANGSFECWVPDKSETATDKSDKFTFTTSDPEAALWLLTESTFTTV